MNFSACEYCMWVCGWVVNDVRIDKCHRDQHIINDTETETCNQFEPTYWAKQAEIRAKKAAEPVQMALF